MTKMTEPEAWRRIAEAFYLNEQIDPAFPLTGICSAKSDLLGLGLISRRLWRGMAVRMQAVCPGVAHHWQYWWPTDKRGREYRVAACLLLALLAEDDR